MVEAFAEFGGTNCTKSDESNAQSSKAVLCKLNAISVSS